MGKEKESPCVHKEYESIAPSTFGALSMNNRDGGWSKRFPLEKGRSIFGPGEHCDIRVPPRQLGIMSNYNNQAEIHVDENNQAWFEAFGGTSATVCGRKIEGQHRLEDTALIETGSRRFIFHAAVPENEARNQQSKPAASPFAKAPDAARFEDREEAFFSGIAIATEAVQSYGGLSLVKKDGSHSQRFPLVERRYLFGRAEYCDIRINLLTVSREHAEIVVDEKDQVWVNSLSKTTETNVCNKPVDGKIRLKHNDLLEIGQRKFIFHANNIPEKLPGSASKGTNGKDAADVGKVQTARSKTGVLREIVNTPTGTMRARLAAKEFAFSPTKKETRLHKGGMNGPDQRDQQCENVSLDLTGNVSKGPTIAKAYRELEGGERTCVPDLKEKMLVEAFEEAQCIIDKAHSEAKNIIARAEADAQRIACGNTYKPLFYNQAQDKDVLLSLQSTQSTKRIEEQDPRGMSSTAMQTTSAHSPQKTSRTPPQSSIAKAERCLAFFDKMVCLNFLAATEHLTETVVQYSTEEWGKILQQAGFSAEDITEILQLLIEDDEDIKIEQKETKGVSATLHLTRALCVVKRESCSPSSAACGDRIQCRAALGLLACDGFPAEGTPSMPATSLVPHLHPQIISDLSVLGQKTDLDSGRKTISPVKNLPTHNVEQGAETPSSPSIRLHPSIRKHPILNWLKKYDPTKDDTVVKNKVDYARNANGSSSNLIFDHQTMDWTCPPPTGLWTFSPRKQTLFCSPRLY